VGGVAVHCRWLRRSVCICTYLFLCVVQFCSVLQCVAVCCSVGGIVLGGYVDRCAYIYIYVFLFGVRYSRVMQ